MAGNIKTNSVTLGDSATDSQNFQLRTNVDGTATLARGAAGNLGDILTVDAAGAMATPLMPFVGTAPVIESGSNANGNYVKFADGTLICTQDAILPLQAIGTKNKVETPWPIPFYTNPRVTYALLDLIGGDGSRSPVGQLMYNGVYYSGHSTASVINSYSYRSATNAAGGTGFLFNIIGIGRWKA